MFPLSMTSKLVIFPILLSSFFNTIDGWGSFKVNFYNSSYDSFTTDVDFNLTITEKGAISAFIDIHKPKMIIHSNIVFLIESSKDKYDLVFMNRSIDGCEFLNNKKYEPILQIIFGMARESGSLPTKCPLDKKLYYMRDMIIDTKRFPPVLPEKKIQLSMMFMSQERKDFLKPIMMFEIYFGIEY